MGFLRFDWLVVVMKNWAMACWMCYVLYYMGLSGESYLPLCTRDVVSVGPDGEDQTQLLVKRSKSRRQNMTCSFSDISVFVP